MRDIILTCDIGTTACKCTAFSAQGEKLADVRIDYATEYPRPGWAQQDADIFADSALRGLKALAGRIDVQRAAVIGLSGQMNGLIPVSADGRALYPSMIHSDSRSTPQLAEIAACMGADDVYGLTGNRLDCHYTLPKLLWLRANAPDVYREMRWALQSKDYVRTRLTGHAGITDFSDAASTLALDIKRGVWADDLLRDLGIDPAIMPGLRPAHDVSGRLCAQAARFTGLPEGIPVAVGGGDGACAARGAGLRDSSSAYCCIGSSAWVAQLTSAPVMDPEKRLYNYFDLDGVHNYLVGVLQCGAAAYDWARQLIGLGGADGIKLMESMAREIKPGAEGVIFFPELMGSRSPYWDPDTRGCLCGFSLFHDRRHIARAVYEGIAEGLYSCAAAMAQNGLPLSNLMLTGGGARSGLWPEIFAALFGVPVSVHSMPGEATSLGAAIAAGVGAGIYAGYAQGAAQIRAAKVYLPDPEMSAAYAKSYEIFSGVYGRIKPVNDAIRDML